MTALRAFWLVLFEMPSLELPSADWEIRGQIRHEFRDPFGMMRQKCLWPLVFVWVRNKRGTTKG